MDELKILKICRRCGFIGPGKGTFRARERSKNGYDNICTDCSNNFSKYKAESLGTTTAKMCQMCKAIKIIEDFGSHIKSKDGLNVRCRDCVNALGKKWRKNNKAKADAANKVWCKANRAKVNNYRKKWMYKIPKDYFETQLAIQGNKCAICRKDFGNEIPQIDHDHNCCSGRKSCGKCVRGLLCNLCNKALGLFGDAEDVLESALVYLRNNASANSNARKSGTAISAESGMGI